MCCYILNVNMLTLCKVWDLLWCCCGRWYIGKVQSLRLVVLLWQVVFWQSAKHETCDVAVAGGILAKCKMWDLWCCCSRWYFGKVQNVRLVMLLWLVVYWQSAKRETCGVAVAGGTLAKWVETRQRTGCWLQATHEAPSWSGRVRPHQVCSASSLEQYWLWLQSLHNPLNYWYW